MMKTLLLMFIVSLGSLLDQSKAQSCSDNWTPIKGKCYRVYTQENTCEGAEAHCSRLTTTCKGSEVKGHLATIPCANLRGQLHGLVSNTGTTQITDESNVFFGLLYNDKRKPVWRDGSKVRSWARKRVPCREDSGTCGAMTRADKNFVTVSEGAKGSYICMLPCVAELNG